MEHFGIRYENDLTDKFSEYIIDSVDLLNAQLAHRDLAFFFDTVDVDQQVIGGMHCEDMFGWVVPNGIVKDFEPIWLAGNDRELEGYDYVCASWEDRDGFPHAVIDGELPEEAYEWRAILQEVRMASDGFEVVAFKILSYLYQCMKGGKKVDIASSRIWRVDSMFSAHAGTIPPRAYGVEGSIAEEAGYNDLAERLQDLPKEEIDGLETDFGSV